MKDELYFFLISSDFIGSSSNLYLKFRINKYEKYNYIEVLDIVLVNDEFVKDCIEVFDYDVLFLNYLELIYS